MSGGSPEKVEGGPQGPVDGFLNRPVPRGDFLGRATLEYTRDLIKYIDLTNKTEDYLRVLGRSIPLDESIEFGCSDPENDIYSLSFKTKDKSLHPNSQISFNNIGKNGADYLLNHLTGRSDLKLEELLAGAVAAVGVVSLVDGVGKKDRGRRWFIKASALTSAGIALTATGCGPEVQAGVPTGVPTTPTSTATPEIIAILATALNKTPTPVKDPTSRITATPTVTQEKTRLVIAATSTPTKTPRPTATPTPPPTETPTPTMTIEPIKTPEPTIARVPVPEQELRMLAVRPFIEAMKMAGVELTEDQVNQSLSLQEFNDKDGNAFLVYVTSNTGTSFSDGVPLIILGQKDREAKWQVVERGMLASSKNILTSAYTIAWLLLQDSKYKETSLKDTNHFQLDDCGIWRYMEQREGDLSELEKIITVAKLAYTKGMTFSLGSGLIWGDPDWGVPEWETEKDLSPDVALEDAKSHIETFLNLFKSLPGFTRVSVVNEILPSIFGTPYYWTDIRGIDRKRLLKECFRKAREVAPNVELALREYSVEFQGYDRSEEFFKLVTDLNKEELEATGHQLIDAVEFQLPLLQEAFIGKDPAMDPINFTDKEKRKVMMEKLRSNFRRFKEAGVKVYVVELMLPIDNLGSTPEEQLKIQAEIFEDIYRVCQEEGVSVGTTRIHSSDDKRYAYPDPETNYLPYPRDGAYRPLPSFYAINRAILSTD